MPHTKPKTASSTKSLHVPRQLHKEISLLAVHRDEDIQDVASRAIEIGLTHLKADPRQHPVTA